MNKEEIIEPPASHFLPLDDEEAQIMADIENGMYQTREVYLPIKEVDLINIKIKADKLGVSYQSIVTALLHRYSTGQIQLDNF
jgi:predicted DNA binding CopG/RHH family protein